MNIYGHIHRYICINVSMYDRNAGFQFMPTNDLDSGFMTTDEEFGICIIFMQSLSWRPRIVASLLSSTGKEWCGDVRHGTHTTELFKKDFFLSKICSPVHLKLMCNTKKPLLAEPSKKLGSFPVSPCHKLAVLSIHSTQGDSRASPRYFVLPEPGWNMKMLCTHRDRARWCHNPPATGEAQSTSLKAWTAALTTGASLFCINKGSFWNKTPQDM